MRNLVKKHFRADYCIMFPIPILQGEMPAGLLGELGRKTGDAAGSTVLQFAGDPSVLAGGIALVVVAILAFFLIKKIIINSILGAMAWAVVTLGFGVNLPLLPSLAVSVIFGPAGIGVMLALRFFGAI